MAGGTGPDSAPPPLIWPEDSTAKGKEPQGDVPNKTQTGEGSGTGGEGSTMTMKGAGRRGPGQCIPKTAVLPSIALKPENLRKRIQYMKDHALIGKFIGIWPTEKALLWWIQTHWKPKGHFDLQLGSKGFFTIIFFNMEDRNRVFEGGPYFFNSAGLYLRFWKEKFNPDKEDLTVAPIWVRLYSLPSEFWLPEVLEDIGNALGHFVKISDQTQLSRYTSYARICVYMNISQDIPEAITLTWEDDEWTQPLDYEHIPFRCRKCHMHGHLFRDCPSNKPSDPPKPKESKDGEGFTKVNNRRKHQKKAQTPGAAGTVNTSNSFDILNSVTEEGHPHPNQGNPALADDTQTEQNPGKGEATTKNQALEKEVTQKDAVEEETPMEEDETGDIEIGELDLDIIEEACATKGAGYIPFKQVQLLKDAILNLKPSPKLGVGGNTIKEVRKKFKETGNKRGRKSDGQRIKEAGIRMVESGMYPTIKEALEQASGSFQ